ncbi:MAG: lactate racemase domain-containing protein [Spirochaetia bacterium]
MLLIGAGGPDARISDDELTRLFIAALDKLGPRRKVIIVPPDGSRIHSLAGLLTETAWKYYGNAVKAVLPALGTHTPMSEKALSRMFPSVPKELFRIHDWRHDVKTLGHLSAGEVEEISGGKVRFDFPVQVNRLLIEDGVDLILSLGQVVPHEVVGMANYTKNILVGTGGGEAIDRSHFLGAVCGLETIMGRIDTPVRRLLDLGARRYLSDLPLVYGMTVREAGVQADGAGQTGTVTRGFFVGGEEAFRGAGELARKTNIILLEEPADRAVVYLDPGEYRSTWIGNKAVYRTRMALNDGGEILILAPGVEEFGEDREIDRLIRRYGYRGTEGTLEAVDADDELASRLSAAAHCIHGSPEGRFTVTYCTGGLSREEIESVGYRWADIHEMLDRYDPRRMNSGVRAAPEGKRELYVPNPGLGLWAAADRF